MIFMRWRNKFMSAAEESTQQEEEGAFLEATGQRQHAIQNERCAAIAQQHDAENDATRRQSPELLIICRSPSC